jgi:hypothetical protein
VSLAFFEIVQLKTFIEKLRIRADLLVATFFGWEKERRRFDMLFLLTIMLLKNNETYLRIFRGGKDAI